MGWKSWKDEFPPIGEKILIINCYGMIKTEIWDGISEYTYNRKDIIEKLKSGEKKCYSAIMYWMELPIIPKKIQEIIHNYRKEHRLT